MPHTDQIMLPHYTQLIVCADIYDMIWSDMIWYMNIVLVERERERDKSVHCTHKTIITMEWLFKDRPYK